MAFQRPSLAQLHARIEADFETHMPDADARLPLNLPSIDAAVHAGASHELHGAIAAQEKKLLPIDGDEQTVLKWATMKGLQRLAATFASGEITHTDAINGNVVAQGTRYLSGSGAVFITQADAVVAGGQVTVSVLAEQAGRDGNLPAGSRLNLESPIAGVPVQATITAGGIRGGADQETVVPALLDRVLFEFRKPPRGGNYNDYIRWARAAHPGVTRVFVSPHELGAGTVVVRFTTDNDVSIIPAAQVVAAVSDYILQRCPLDARNISVEAPNAVLRNIDFTSLSPNTQAVRAAITLELQDLFRRSPVPGQRMPDSKISEVASVALGEESHNFTSSNTPLTGGDIELLGAVTWPPVV